MFKSERRIKIAQRIKDERKKLGISQDELAAKINYSKPTIVKWESGNGKNRIPNYDQLIDLCSVFNCDPGYILCEYDYRKKENALIYQSLELPEFIIDMLREYTISYRGYEAKEFGESVIVKSESVLIIDVLSFLISSAGTIEKLTIDYITAKSLNDMFLQDVDKDLIEEAYNATCHSTNGLAVNFRNGCLTLRQTQSAEYRMATYLKELYINRYPNISQEELSDRIFTACFDYRPLLENEAYVESKKVKLYDRFSAIIKDIEQSISYRHYNRDNPMPQELIDKLLSTYYKENLKE